MDEILHLGLWVGIYRGIYGLVHPQARGISRSPKAYHPAGHSARDQPWLPGMGVNKRRVAIAGLPGAIARFGGMH